MKRREFFKKAGIAIGIPFWMGVLPENLQAKIPSGMKITGLKTFMVGSRNVFEKIYTNKGVAGLGQGIAPGLNDTLDAAIRDRRGWRLFSEADIKRIEEEANKIK